MILYGHDSLQDILASVGFLQSSTPDLEEKVEDVFTGTGCTSFMPSNDQINEPPLERMKKLRESNPGCNYPNCPEQPMSYAYNRKEGALDLYCYEHWGLARDKYYDTAGPWVATPWRGHNRL